MTDAAPTAALLIIGNEILSGRTQDVNLNAVAKKLGGVGIPLRETRVVPDIESEIVAALNALRVAYTYVFTTGGIGPRMTISRSTPWPRLSASKLPNIPRRAALLEKHYGLDKLTAARLRMARLPVGATLVHNPVSAAPGRQNRQCLCAGGRARYHARNVGRHHPDFAPGTRHL